MNEKNLGAARFPRKFLLQNILMLVLFCMPFMARANVDLQFYNDPYMISSSGQWGQNVNLFLSIANYGSSQSGSFAVELTLNGVHWTTITCPSIDAMTAQNWPMTVTLPNPIPSGLSSSGSFYVFAKIVSNNRSVQVGSINISVPYPDLVGYQGAGPYDFGYMSFNLDQTSTFWGQTISVSYGVANQTPGSAGAFNVGIYISKTNHFSANDPTNCKLIALCPMSAMSGDSWYINPARQGGYTNIKMPSTNPFNDGTTVFYVGMVIDPYNQIPETNKSNNANQGVYKDMADHPLTIINQPNIQVTPSSVSFGSVDADGVGGAVGTQNVTIVNNGSLPLNISSISTSGSSFAIKSIASNVQSLSQPVTSGSVQAFSTENWIVTLTFDPTVTGTQTGSLTINSNDPAHSVTTIALSGVGAQLPRISFLDPVAPNNDLVADYGSIANDGSGGVSSTQIFTLANLGSGALTVNQNGISLTDTAGGVWSIVSITSNTQGAINLSSTSATIAPGSGETWSIAVKFDPVANTNYTTGLQVVSDDPNQGTLTCTLKGAGATPMTLSVTDSIGDPNDHAMNFGSAHATGNDKRTGIVTLTNTGQLPLTLPQNGIVLTGTTNFQITGIQSSTQGAISLSGSAGGILAPNQAETWTVGLVFDPVASGALSSQLNILSNDPAHGTMSVVLSGTGLNQPGIVVADNSGDPNDHSIAYGNVLNDGPGNHVASQTVTIQNIGLQPLVIPKNGLSMSGSTGFSIQNITSSTQGTINLSASSANVAPNQAETWTATVAFDPTTNTPYTGSVTIQSNDPANPTVAVALSGTGATPTISLQPQTAGLPTLYIPAGQVYNIAWNASYAVGNAQIALYRDTDTNPSSGLVQITGSIPYTGGTSSISSYAWRPDSSLIGQEFYIYGSIQDGIVSNGSYSAQKVHIEAAGSFNLLSPLITANTNYTYQYIYNGKVYAGVTTLQPGQNVVTITTPLQGGGNAIHQITVNQVASLLATQGYTYDEMNRVKTYTNGNGIVTTYTYNLDGTLRQTSASNGNTVNYSYDSLQRKTSMTDSTGTTFYDYDDLDRVTFITYSANAIKGDADDLVLGYGYDNANRLTSITYPGGEQVNYTFDNAGRMLTASDLATGQNTTYVYATPPLKTGSSATGLLLSSTLANGIGVQYGYNNVGLLNDIKYSKGSNLLAEFYYSLNADGNADSLLTTFPDGSQKQEKYTYDGQNRLTQVIYGSTVTASANDKTVIYTYDGVGNRLTQTTKINGSVTQTLTYAYGSENRLLQVTDQNGVQVASYVYDSAGNRIQKITPSGDTFYTYDERNLLTSVLTPSDYITYAYNGAAQRVSKTVDGITTNYIVDPSRSVFQNVQEWSGGAITKSYVYGIDRLECNPVSGSPQFYLPDRLGSVRFVTDASGNVTATYNYDVFGAQQ